MNGRRKAFLPPSTNSRKSRREKAKALYQGYVPSEVTIINDPERMNKALKDGNISAVKINSLVSGHLAINRKSFGFVEVVNPAPDKLKDASLLLTPSPDSSASSSATETSTNA